MLSSSHPFINLAVQLKKSSDTFITSKLGYCNILLYKQAIQLLLLSLLLYERFTNPIPHSFATLSSTTKLGLGLSNKVMSTCELSKLGLDETRKVQ